MRGFRPAWSIVPSQRSGRRETTGLLSAAEYIDCRVWPEVGHATVMATFFLSDIHLGLGTRETERAKEDRVLAFL